MTERDPFADEMSAIDEAPAEPHPAQGRPDLGEYIPPRPRFLELRHETLGSEYSQIGPRISDQARILGPKIVAAGLAEAERKRVEAKLQLQARAMLEMKHKAGGPKVTEAMVEATWRSEDPFSGEWLDAVRKEFETQAAREVAKADLTALIREADMLSQAAQDRRKELGTIDPVVRTSEEEARRASSQVPVYDRSPKQPR